MSSPEPHKHTLIPAGLPVAYIGSYAVVGIASLAYISVMMSGPGRATLDIAAPDRFAHSTEAGPPRYLASTETTGPRQTEVEASSNESTALANDAAPTPSPTSQQAELIEPAPPSPNIETKYVTTQQILASRSARTPEAESVSAVTEQPNLANDLSASSNIVTGSIAVPPPPERAPTPPAVIRAALKPAVAPALSAASPAPQRPAAKPVAPIDFGPAVVTEARVQPEATAALAVLLATGSSVESLRLTWNLLQERHAAALVDLSPRYIVETNPSAPDRSFALLAGPVVSATAVARVCSALVSEGLTCRTRPFGGNSL